MTGQKMTKMRSVVFNGKFCVGALNGVRRVAGRLVREVDKLLAASAFEEAPLDCSIVVPRGYGQAVPGLRRIRVVEDDRSVSQAWEQLRLPRLAAGAVLVNLANLAPIAHRRKVTMLHDAQFCRSDSSYPVRQRLGYRLLTPLMARTSERVLTVSAFSRDELRAFGITGQRPVDVLHNGADHIREVEADTVALQRLGLVQSSYAILFGSIKTYKNNRVVFDAFAAGALAPLRLVIIGPDRAELEAANLDPPDDAVFVGPCDDGVLRALYEGAQALLFPSLTEGFGLPPVEAMLCGCPVIVAPCGALPEVCDVAALYADPFDPKDWQRQLRALAFPALRQAQVAAGLERATAYTWVGAGERLLTLLNELARSR